MGRMTRTRAKYRIAQRVKYEDTKPERVVEGILIELDHKYRVRQPLLVDAPAPHNKGWKTAFTITPDFVVSRYSQPDYPGDYLAWKFVEVDGEYHDTPIQQRKTKWRDKLLLSVHPVIHVDAELTKNKAYQTYLKDKLALAINSDEKVVRIDA